MSAEAPLAAQARTGLFTRRPQPPRGRSNAAGGALHIRKFEGVGLGAVLAMSATLTACGRSNDWQASAGPARVCVDRNERRLPDDDCRPHQGGAPIFVRGWYYIPSPIVRDSGVPPVGGAVLGGDYTPSPGVYYRSPPAGGVARGGFGGTGEGAGEGGHGAGE